MFNNGIFSFLQILTNILPRAEAAAVWIIPLHPKVLKFSINPITVKGLTMPELAQESGTSFSISNVLTGFATAYSHQDPLSEVKHTLLPTHDWSASPLASTTVPEPSIPQSEGKGRLKYAPWRKIRSEGLIVEPSTFTRSSPWFRVGIGWSYLRWGF